jgi:four helix bundle protein
MSQANDIHQRVFSFVVRGLKVIPHIPQRQESRIIIDQYARALTSVGANDNEADGTSTKKDFIHVYTVVRKELKETQYWLRIIANVYEVLSPRLDGLLQESDELIRIISVIIANTKKKL